MVIADQRDRRARDLALFDDIWRVALAAKLPGAHRARSPPATRSWKMPRAKAALYESTGALAVDMESAVAARFAAARNLPFAVLRVISDDAGHVLPPAALVAMKPDGGIALGRVLGSLLRHPLQVPGLIRTARGLEQGVQGITPLPRTSAVSDLPDRISDIFFSTWREKTNSAGRWCDRSISGAIGPSVFTPSNMTGSDFSGCLIASVAAVPSKPQCTMQLAHFSYLPTPYFSHSVPSISSLKVFT